MGRPRKHPNNNGVTYETVNDKKLYWSTKLEHKFIEYITNHTKYYEYIIDDEIKKAQKTKTQPNFQKIQECYNHIHRIQNFTEEQKQYYEQLFTKYIHPALYHMAQNILLTYNIRQQLVSIEEQIRDCVSFVVIKMFRFNIEKNKKSYSYISAIIKHYFIELRKEEHKQQTKQETINTVKDQRKYKDTKKDQTYIDKLMCFLQQKLQEYINQQKCTKTQHILMKIQEYLKNPEILQNMKNNITRKKIINIIAQETNSEPHEVKCVFSQLKTIYKKWKQEFIP